MIREPFDGREDYNHVLKRVNACTSAGSIPDIIVRVFVACFNAPCSGLTYSALSVPVCERMFFYGVLDFSETSDHKYHNI